MELTGSIVDIRSKKAIPYAHVFLRNHKQGVTALRNGSFYLPLSEVYKDSLLITCMGYQPKTLYLPSVDLDESLHIELKEVKHQLKEVVVKPREMDKLTLGLDKGRAKSCNGTRAKQPHARFFPNNSKVEGFIESVAVYVCEEGVFEASFRVNLLKTEPLTGSPSEPLISEDFILKSEGDGNEWVSLDLSSAMIEFPPEGFFVSVEQLPLDSEQLDDYASRYPEIEKEKLEYSAPEFGFRYEDYDEVFDRYWIWHFNEWEMTWDKHNLKAAEEHGVKLEKLRFSSPMIKAEISYYED